LGLKRIVRWWKGVSRKGKGTRTMKHRGLGGGHRGDVDSWPQIKRKRFTGERQKGYPTRSREKGPTKKCKNALRGKKKIGGGRDEKQLQKKLVWWRTYERGPDRKMGKRKKKNIRKKERKSITGIRNNVGRSRKMKKLKRNPASRKEWVKKVLSNRVNGQGETGIFCGNRKKHRTLSGDNRSEERVGGGTS